MDFKGRTIEKDLRHDAQRKDEWATKALWQYLFQKFIFPEKEWVILSEFPPRDNHSQRRVDIVCKQWKLVFFYMEVKRGKATETDVTNAEKQAFEACATHFEYNDDGRDYLWAITCFGPCIRIWTASRDAKILTPYFPKEGDGRKSYVDIALRQDEIMNIFGLMRSNVVPSENFLEPSTSHAQDQGPGGPSDSGATDNSTLFVDDGFVYVAVTRAGDDGWQSCTSTDGSVIQLWSNDWVPAQVLLQGRYEWCYALWDQGTGRWYWTTQ